MQQSLTSSTIATSASHTNASMKGGHGAKPSLATRFGMKMAANAMLATALTGGLFAEALSAAPREGANASLATAVAQNSTHKNAIKPRRLNTKLDPVEALLYRKMRDRVDEIDAYRLPGTMVIKFRDEVKARAGIAGGKEVVSLGGSDLSQIQSLLSYYNADVRQWIRKSESDLASLEARAREMSRKEQPDLAGMILVSNIEPALMFEAARALNDSSLVEFISIDRHIENLQCGDPATPGCERPAPTCANPAPGNDTINRTECNPDPGGDDAAYGCNDNNCCTQISAIDPTCNDPDSPDGWDVFCAAYANLLCGPTIHDPDAPGLYDPCFYDETAPDFIIPDFQPVYVQFQNGSCVTPHSNPGCNQPECCNAVCLVDPTCCAADNGAWDATCANLVLSGQFASCIIPEPADESSPDLTPFEGPLGLQGYQFYLQGGARAPQLDDYANLGETWLGAQGGGDTGFSAQGLSLQEMDDFQNMIWEFYQGGVPGTNPFLKGGGVRVGVLETSGYYLHEDFLLAGPAKNATRPWEGPLLAEPKVTLERGQSPIYAEIGGISSNHGTNVMGVILAADNGFGVTGIATNASGFFYPIVSAEAGYRAQDAMTNCYSEFELGDVANISWGLRAGSAYFPTMTNSVYGVDPVTSSAAYSLVIGVGSDLGVTSVVAAGSGAQPIAGSGEEDVGAIITTAVYPGNILNGTTNLPGYRTCESGIDEENLNLVRYPGSNWNAEDAANPDETAAVSGWGYAVATTGATTNYANVTVPNEQFALFQGLNDQPPTEIAPGLQTDRLRTYTQNFGGTSAAAAMISGVIARMQAACKQFYGTAISPTTVRGILTSSPSGFGICFCSQAPFRDAPWGEGPPFEASSCAPPICTGADECLPIGCPCEIRAVANFPNLNQIPGQILSADIFGDGTPTEIDVLTGGQLVGYAWNKFQIRVVDQNYLRITGQRANAGSQVAGLNYLATGPTTDVRVRLESPVDNPQKEVNSLGLRLVSRATKNFVFVGVFARNFNTNRYEYFGADFMTTQDGLYEFPMPDLGDFSPYINPADNKFEMRVWTCGIGNVGRHIVLHDLIEIAVNQPFNPIP